MATLLDIGLLEHFAPMFVFLLVFVVLYGVLAKTKPFGDDMLGVYALLSAVVGFLVLLFPPITEFITLLAPYFTAYALLIFFVIFLFLVFGVKPSAIADNEIMGRPLVHWTVIVGAIFILLFLFSQVWGDDLASDGDQIGDSEGGVDGGAGGELNTRITDILFSPVLLGAVFLLVIAAFAVRFLTVRDA